MSLFTHSTVLFTPITTVIVEGEYPVELGYAAPRSMLTRAVAGLADIVDVAVLVDW